MDLKASIYPIDWKLIFFYESLQVKLYNLKNDIGERHNFAAKEPELAPQLRALLFEWLIGTKAALPRLNK